MKCVRCGHDYDDHHDITLEPGCRCLSCYVFTPRDCRVGLDPEDDDPRCDCPGFVMED